MEVRINKYIASAEDISRRKADDLIKESKVKLNGKIVTEPGISVKTKDKVEVCGRLIKVQPKKYIKFYKPSGYITTKKDENDRKTIYDLIPAQFQHLKSVGRLDRNSTGLLILTNDGELIQNLTHPKIKIPKVYHVTLEGKLNPNDLVPFQKGIELEPGKVAFADTAILERTKDKTLVEITLYQGYNRQIRRMADFIEHPVVSLKRVSHANITISGLERGKFKILSPKEVSELKNYIRKIQQKSKN
jgi:23S rRNA pseudouridine2605 synthase